MCSSDLIYIHALQIIGKQRLQKGIVLHAAASEPPPDHMQEHDADFQVGQLQLLLLVIPVMTARSIKGFVLKVALNRLLEKVTSSSQYPPT